MFLENSFVATADQPSKSNSLKNVNFDQTRIYNMKGSRKTDKKYLPLSLSSFINLE